jgi:molybdopterin-binding protein
MRISARNALRGKVTKLIEGPVSTEVTVQVAKGIEIVSSVTSASVKRLGLKKGKLVYVVIKASSVMIATD